MCPNGCDDNFEASAVVIQTWKVDCYGEFISVIDDCSEVYDQPDMENIWNCVKCGYDAKFVTISEPDNNLKEPTGPGANQDRPASTR